MEIIIRRESVCMGDDADNHALKYSIGISTKFSDIFKDLINRKYFPNISDGDAVWTLFCGEDDLISWKTKENTFYSRFVTKEPTILSVKRWANPTIHFRYYSLPIKRARQIFKMFSGSKFHIWHEGFMNEYETYCIPKTVEEDWNSQLVSSGRSNS